MRTQAVEDYLKTIYDLQRGGTPVTTSAIAARLSVSPGTVTGMVKKLASLNLLTHESYRGVLVTEAGRRIAVEVIRHHRLVERYLHEAMGVPWDQVHAEAEKWEHILSDVVEERMDEILGSPTTDPHGSPIPTPELELLEVDHPMLASLEAGESARVAEVGDEDAAMLRYFAELGLFPGAFVEVLAIAPFEGPITLRVDGTECSIGQRAAEQVFMTEIQGGEA